MQIAYLKRSSIKVGNQTIGETFSLVEGSNANETAMLKARTLLAYLWDASALPAYEAGDWCMFYTPMINNEAEIKTIESTLLNLSEDTVAIMPVLYMEDTHKQLGVIAIRKGEELQRIFVNSFLDSSRKWLQTHKRELKELQEHFPVG